MLSGQELSSRDILKPFRMAALLQAPYGKLGPGETKRASYVVSWDLSFGRMRFRDKAQPLPLLVCGIECVDSVIPQRPCQAKEYRLMRLPRKQGFRPRYKRPCIRSSTLSR
jgi:hypothetical protein